jgi:hypothetical protein
MLVGVRVVIVASGVGGEVGLQAKTIANPTLMMPRTTNFFIAILLKNT